MLYCDCFVPAPRLGASTSCTVHGTLDLRFPRFLVFVVARVRMRFASRSRSSSIRGSCSSSVSPTPSLLLPTPGVVGTAFGDWATVFLNRNFPLLTRERTPGLRRKLGYGARGVGLEWFHREPFGGMYHPGSSGCISPSRVASPTRARVLYSRVSQDLSLPVGLMNFVVAGR